MTVEQPPEESPGQNIPPSTAVAEETTPLITNKDSTQDPANLENGPISETQHPASPKRSVFGIISVLLIGVFVSQADTTLVLATYAHITSEFHRLGDGTWIDGSWIFTSFGLATCATQPMYGRLSQIFGRKVVLQASYVLFLLGTALTGCARSMVQIIFGRVVQGAGGAGMVCMVSILLTDLVPLHEVAAYRSYVNVFSTVGRSCGGLLGGYLTQTIGWRWAFLCQCPLLLLSILLVGWKLNEPQHTLEPNQSILTKLKRIDFIGAFFMSTAILSGITALDFSGKKADPNTPILIMLIAVFTISAILFAITEKFWAKEPIFPLDLLTSRAVLISYMIVFLQTGYQVALMFLVPLYFQVTSAATLGQSGAHLVPAVFGNTIGGLLTGHYIKRTGRPKPPTILSSLSALTCFTLLLLFWRGHTSSFQSLFIFFGGCATGTAHSAVFVGLTAAVRREDMPVAASGMYLSINVGSVVGVSVASAVFQGALRRNLGRVLRHVPEGREIAQKVLSDVAYVQTLHGSLKRLVKSAFIFSFQRTFSIQLALAGFALVLAILSSGKRIVK